MLAIRATHVQRLRNGNFFLTPTVQPRVDELVAYFESTWISGQYRFRQWNYFDFQGPRTNNNVEGWHSRLKKVVGKPHPNLYEIIYVFKREEAR